jgi:hypothetical protein
VTHARETVQMNVVEAVEDLTNYGMRQQGEPPDADNPQGGPPGTYTTGGSAASVTSIDTIRSRKKAKQAAASAASGALVTTVWSYGHWPGKHDVDVHHADDQKRGCGPPG